MPDLDVAVVGNGALGSYAAAAISRALPSLSVALVGSCQRPGSASAAAGAMANVYAEIETCWSGDDSWMERQIRIGVQARNMWRDFFNETNSQNLITAEDTYVYLKRDSSPFERSNFEAMVNYMQQDKAGSVVSESSAPLRISIDTESGVILRGEFGFAAYETLRHMTEIGKHQGVRLIDSEVIQIENTSSDTVLVLTNGEQLRSRLVVVAAGAQTFSLLEPLGVLPMLQGVGSAISLNSSDVLAPLRTHVVRTVNRGGAQCGLHTVPGRDGGIYLGAGNYITSPGPADHRIETIRYLFDQFEREMLGPSAAYAVTGRFKLGNRPRSIDGYPMIGPLSQAPTIFVATATNRVGFCWAPAIAEATVSWVRGGSPFTAVKDLEGFLPDRAPLPFSTAEQALNYFVESRIGAALEHSLVGNDVGQLHIRREELRTLGEKLFNEVGTVQTEAGADMALNPDNWTALADISRQIC